MAVQSPPAPPPSAAGPPIRCVRRGIEHSRTGRRSLPVCEREKKPSCDGCFAGGGRSPFTRVGLEVYRTVPNRMRYRSVPKRHHFGTLRAQFGPLRSLCCRLATSDPVGPRLIRLFPSNRRPGIRTRDRQARRATRKPLRHVHKMHEKMRL